MKISLNTIKDFNERYNCTGDVTVIGIDKLIERVGARLGDIDKVIDVGAKYQGIIVVKVVSCVKHPNADKLSLCKVDDDQVAKDVERDENGYVQVVCGAPNVREGLSVAWLPPGSTVPDSYEDEPFVLEARDLRGQKSNGMLASPKELALSDSHAGILEIEGDPAPGTDFATLLGLDDTVLDIENKMFTHRPDLFGYLGISRELAGIQQMKFKSPDWYKVNPAFPEVEVGELRLKVTNELPELVPRFTMIVMCDVEVGPSPLWLQSFLSEMGQRSINNIVDYTNFFMMQTGQPLHAYDYDKVKSFSNGDAASITIRKPNEGEKIKLLNGKEIEPRAEAIMIASDKALIGLAGVMGGSETEVDYDTKNIILECGTFDMYSVRRTSMAHGIFTDAVTRFTKGQSPLQNLAVLAKIFDEIGKYANGKVGSGLIDDNHVDPEVLQRASLYAPVSLTQDFVNSRLGLSLELDEMKSLLTNVEFEVETNGEILVVKAPFWRTDIELAEDIVEEIGRLYGYEKIPLSLPSRDLTPADKDPMLALKAQVRTNLANAGANEVLTYSFVHGDLLKNVGQDSSMAYQIGNALSPDLQYYRLSLAPSLLNKVFANIKAGFDEFALFELGKAHATGLEENGIPSEMERLALVFAANSKAAKKYDGAAYYQARKYLTSLLKDMNVNENLAFEPLDEQKYLDQTKSKIAYYQTGRSATLLIGDVVLGEIGEYKASVRNALKLPAFSAGFELDLNVLEEYSKTQKNYTELSNYPSVNQDITLKVESGTSYSQIFQFVKSSIEETKTADTTFSLSPVNIYQSDEDNQTKNITFRLTIASYDRTLTDKEVNLLLDKSSQAAKSELSAKRV